MRFASLCRLTQATAVAALAASVTAMGLVDPALPEGPMGDALDALAVALLLSALMMLRDLALRRQLRLPEFEAALIRAVLSGTVFIAVVYHLSGLVGFFAPVRVALDRLMPVWADHLLGLAPGLMILVAAEAVLRRRPPKDAPKEAKNGKL